MTDEDLEPIMERVAKDAMLLAKNNVEQIECTLDYGATMIVQISFIPTPAIATPKRPDANLPPKIPKSF